MHRSPFHLRPQTAVEAACGTVTLAFTMRSLIAFERETGRSISSITERSRLIRTLIWSLTREHHESLTLMDIGTIWTLDQYEEVIQEAIGLIRASSPDISPAPAPNAKDDDTGSLDWEHLWSVGRVDLHLSEEEFWSLTPGLFHCLLKRIMADTDGSPDAPKPGTQKHSDMLLKRVEMINEAMHGLDLRGKK